MCDKSVGNKIAFNPKLIVKGLRRNSLFSEMDSGSRAKHGAVAEKARMRGN
jgi:hypothetical protein